jgi:hypothetical protein
MRGFASGNGLWVVFRGTCLMGLGTLRVPESRLIVKKICLLETSWQSVSGSCNIQK